MEEVAIVGVGESNVSRKCGIPVTELSFEAFQEAMSGLDLQNKKVDASIIC